MCVDVLIYYGLIQNAPDILLYDDEMVAEMLDQIKNQVLFEHDTYTSAYVFVSKIMLIKLVKIVPL